MTETDERMRRFWSLLPRMYEHGNIQQLKRTEETEPIIIQIIADAFEIGIAYQKEMEALGISQQDS